ncbi:VWA domain-containing protein [Halobaculum sp. MBLA0147]|uniref:vWA domain-containing protein n=1 Tax=Halobaculum sp. MBLA0147 TaxID=3079934 RepID=UPI0035256058
MTDDGRNGRLALSRRRVLAGLGSIGVASAGAGLGTSAYFSDTEAFTGNSLAAGSLDMKVSYEEHYSDWSPDETEGIDESDVSMEQPDDLGNTTGILGDDVGPVWVSDGNVSTFQDNTLNNDPEDGEPIRLDPEDPCGSADDANDDPAAKIDLGDVKPGDFGEVTFDFALCDNPGYVWFQGALESASENGVTEPEAEDPDEEEGVVELLDAVRTRVWYDENCDNVAQLAPEPACVDLVVDTSGSMEDPVYANGDPTITKAEAANQIGREIVTTVDALDGNDDGVLGSGPPGSLDNFRFAVNSFADVDTIQTPLTDDEQAVLDGLDQALTNTPAGGTNVDDALDLAANSLADCTHDERYAVLITNNPSPDSSERQSIRDSAANLKDVEGVTVKVIALDVDPTGADADFWRDVATDASETFFVYQDGGVGSPGGDDDVRAEMSAAAANVVSQIAGGGSEELVFDGTLREVLTTIESDVGLPLDGDREAAARQCFDPNERHCVGFGWWLPVNHANEIQTDSATFDLGFYTEQCRHNDGSGMAPEETATPDGGEETTTVTVEGFPSSDDAGNSLESLDLNADFDASGVVVENLSIDGQSLSFGRSTSNGGQTVELRSIGGNVSLSTDFPARVELSGVPTGLGTQTVGFVFEPDDDSSEDDTDTFTT